MGLVRFPMSSARFRQVFLSAKNIVPSTTRPLQTCGRANLQTKWTRLRPNYLVKPTFTVVRTNATTEAIKCAICDFITSKAKMGAVLGLLLLGLVGLSCGTVCWKCSWRHLSFAGREVSFEDFVTKYLASGEVVRVHYFTDDRVWVERAYEPDMRRWMNHFDREIDKEIKTFLSALQNSKVGNDPKKMGFVSVAGSGMKEIKQKRWMKRILKKITRILSRSPESMQKVNLLIERLNKDIIAKQESVKKAVTEIEMGDMHKPLTDILVRMTTADEMLRVFIEISEYEHVYFHVETRNDLNSLMEEGFSKAKLRSDKRAAIVDHSHRSIEILL